MRQGKKLINKKIIKFFACLLMLAFIVQPMVITASAVTDNVSSEISESNGINDDDDENVDLNDDEEKNESTEDGQIDESAEINLGLTADTSHATSTSPYLDSDETQDGLTKIDTGGSEIEAVTENDTNLNTTDLCSDCAEEADEQDPVLLIDAENDNEALTANNIGLDAASGQNGAETAGDAEIQTGDIGIINILINYINHNVMGEGKEFFINLFNKILGNIDLSGYGDASANSGRCAIEPCDLSLDNTSSSTLANKVVINADTGENIIVSTGEASNLIETGDIAIANDIINIANLNIAGDDWFFAVVNIFGEFEGDIVLPGADEADLAAEDLDGDQAPSELIVTNSNFSDVLNNIVINAETGQNSISGDGEGTINTGNIFAQSQIFNLINYNIFGNTWKFARVNVFGTWNGFVQGLPAGYSYFEDENGITIYNEFLENPEFYEAYANLVINNENTASTTNDIEINANTGQNSILHNGGDSVINTGDISIKNNLLNFINSNFIGNNWEFSLINVFGKWMGNLAFGQPELWVTKSAQPEHTPTGKNDYITYTIMFGNSGDGLAKDVNIVDDFDEKFVYLIEAGEGMEAPENISWNLGNLPPNSQGSFSYTARVLDSIPYGEKEYIEQASISSLETDRDYSNNTFSTSVLANGGIDPVTIDKKFRISTNSDNGSLPILSIVKTNDAKNKLKPNDEVNFQIKIKNSGSAPLYEVFLADAMMNEKNEEVHREFWNLETVRAGEEVIIDYTIQIKENIESGVYINQAIVEGLDKQRNKFISAVASSKISVENLNYQNQEQKFVNLGISKITKNPTANPGEEMECRIVVTNNSNYPGRNLVISEILPDGLTFKGSDRTINEWNFDSIGSGEFNTIDYVIVVSEKAKSGLYNMITSAKTDNGVESLAKSKIEIKDVSVLGVDNDQVPAKRIIPATTKSAKIETSKIDLQNEMAGASEFKPDFMEAVSDQFAEEDGMTAVSSFYKQLMALTLALGGLLLSLLGIKKFKSN